MSLYFIRSTRKVLYLPRLSSLASSKDATWSSRFIAVWGITQLKKIITSEADLTTTRRSTMLSRLKNVEKRRPPPLLVFSTKLLQLNQSRKLKVQTTRETNRNAYGAQKNEMMQMETDGSFVITVVISITCNARCCSTRKTNIMISILKVKSFIVTNVNLDSEHFHC